LDRVIANVTENMKTASFLLEKEYQWDKALTYDQQKKNWEDMNLITMEHNDLPKLPILVVQGQYKTSPKEIKEAYYRLNPGWKETLDRVKQRIIDVRTDKEQYERNLRNLETNDQTLRLEIKSFTGKLIPPFPDTNLYSSIFYTPELAESSDLTWKMLLGTIDANTLYYHQELGKYNILKKEECHLASVYMQLTTRMKLWILRERIRVIDWEMKNSDLFKEEPVSIHLRDTLVTKASSYEVPDKRKRSYQCIDFCQCEFGCSLKFLSEAPALKVKEKK